jgi:hypothetical protein
MISKKAGEPAIFKSNYINDNNYYLLLAVFMLNKNIQGSSVTTQSTHG